MKKKNPLAESELICDLAIKGIQEKKGEEICLIDLRNIKNAVADYFILCTGNSSTHIDSLSDAIEDRIFEQTKSWPWHSEGRENKEWILLDYVNVVVHVFNRERRTFYGLEELWGDAPIHRYK